MVLPNPFYIDQYALHQPSILRLLSYGLTTGQEGVLESLDCAVKALGTPGAQIQAMPGVYNAKARHLGASKQSYLGEIPVAETSQTISATTSSGGRTDLVMIRVENPYVTGSGTWAEPVDRAAGPYAYLRVIEGVPNTTHHHTQINANWSGTTLARIDRPASTGVVNQSHITDLRSVAALGGTRTVIYENPPVTVPPIAQQVFAASTNCNNNHVLALNQSAWVDWPSQATWQVPVPDWARRVAVMMTGTPASSSHAWGEIRLNFGGTTFSPREFDINNAPDQVVNVYRAVIPYGGVYTVPDATRGKVVTVKVQAHSNMTTGGSGRMLIADKVDVDGSAGCYFDMWLLFQRVPA